MHDIRGVGARGGLAMNRGRGRRSKPNATSHAGGYSTDLKTTVKRPGRQKLAERVVKVHRATGEVVRRRGV